VPKTTNGSDAVAQALVLYNAEPDDLTDDGETLSASDKRGIEIPGTEFHSDTAEAAGFRVKTHP
jgi:hypothetical protein